MQNSRIGIIVRSDLTGLGNQSKAWYRLLNPSKVIIIDSTPFNGNRQYPEWYSGVENRIVVKGFPEKRELNSILADIDILLTFEIPYNYDLFSRAKELGVKTILISNFEFCDYFQRFGLATPDVLAMHSKWRIDEVTKLAQANGYVFEPEYLPTPIFTDDYDEIVTENTTERDVRRFLHVAGRKTHLDRNGTEKLIQAVSAVPSDIKFEVIIKTQPNNIETKNLKQPVDSRIKFDYSEPEDERELYRGFDVMIMPRRYAGACLPMQEALGAGLPVIMPNIDPNNKILPKNWLVRAVKSDSFMARTTIDVYDVDIQKLADKIQYFATISGDELATEKEHAINCGMAEFDNVSVKGKWDSLVDMLT